MMTIMTTTMHNADNTEVDRQHKNDSYTDSRNRTKESPFEFYLDTWFTLIHNAFNYNCLRKLPRPTK